jgi:PAS domain S-box-containing protein
MRIPPLPPDEIARLAALQACDILDTPPEQAFDDISRLAAVVCGAPTALVTLVDGSRQWFKSRLGLRMDETHRDLAFCAHAILDSDLLVVPDAALDDRFADNPLVTGAPGVRFYAGAPIVLADGHALGTVAVIDYVPRVLTEEQREALRALARQAAMLLGERRRSNEERQLLVDRASAALRQSEARDEAMNEERLRFALEGANDGLWDVSLATGAVYLSPRGCEILGYRPEELPEVARVWSDLVHPDDLPETHARLTAHLNGLAPLFEVEQRLRTRSGDWKWVLSRGKVVERDAAGRPMRMTGTHSDITARKHTEESLRQSQRDLEQAQAVGHVGSWVSGLHDDGSLQWSPECCRIFGVAPAEFDRRPATFWRFVHPEDRAVARRAAEAAVAARRPYVVDFRIVRPDGSVRWLHQRAAIEHDAGGREPRVVGVVQDVTERRQAEEALRDSEAKYRAIVGSDAFPICLIDGEEQRLAEVNEAFARLYGYTKAELEGGMDLGGITADNDASMAVLERARTEGAVFIPLGHHRKKDGTVFPVALTAGLFHWRGRSLIAVLLHDITDRRQLEDQLRQAHKMEAVGQLAGGVAHDFNNILAAQLMQLSLLREQPRLDAEMQYGLAELEKGAHRAAALVRQLLMFSRQSVKQARALDLNELVENLLRMLRRVLGEHISVEWRAGTNLPLLEADPGMVEQVVMNLCVNARDAMPRGGCLLLSTSLVEVGPATSPFLTLTVADTGTGMDDATLKRIFEPFFTTKDVGAGTGLGLATVDGVVKQHGGWVEVESEIGRGSTFRVFLPALSASTPADDGTSARAARGGTETVLLVEDEGALRRMVKRSLSRQGYRVLEAADGQEALAVWRDHMSEIVLLFTDMVMPEGLTGLELAGRLQAEKPDLKVIVSTGYSADLARDGEATGAAVTSFPKPYDLQALAEVVRRCLDGVDA